MRRLERDAIKALSKFEHDDDRKDAVALLTLIAEGYEMQRKSGSVYLCISPAHTVYYVTHNNCSCPAWKVCKHFRAMRAARKLFKTSEANRHAA